MKLLLVTDAWEPQINGVVRTWQRMQIELTAMGHGMHILHPGLFRTLPCPTYPEIRLAIAGCGAVAQQMKAVAPDAVHIATEGPLGLAARRVCLRRGLPFTTSFHTKFPEYIEQRLHIPHRYGYRFLRWFHAPAARMLVATNSLQSELECRGFTNCQPWTRGVDTALFHPSRRISLPYPAPILLYVGRVAIEKNIEAFLQLPHPGSKLIIGDGPQRATLEARFPQAHFLGPMQGETLASYYASADLFVFPSKTDTFGLVMLEALSSGTPVAAYPVTGPLDVLTDRRAAIMDNDLHQAAQTALALKREDCRRFAEGYSWRKCAEMLIESLAMIAPSPAHEV